MIPRFSRPARHDPQPGTAPLEDCGYSAEQVAVLEIMRFFFVAYSDPGRHAWETAFSHARKAFGETRGPVMAAKVLEMVQAMRYSRKSVFRFSNPYCECCRLRISNSERHMLDAVCALRRGDTVGARANALVLCEGFETDGFLDAARNLVAEGLVGAR